MVKGIVEQLKDPKVLGVYDKPFNLKDLESLFIKRFNSRQRKYENPRKLTWEETQAFTNFTQEEYENSSGLYILPDGSMTGKGGWDLYANALMELAKRKYK